MPKKTRKMVHVVWEDSAGAARWDDEKRATRNRTVMCETVGVLLRRDRKHTVIASSVCEETETVSDVMSIPAGCVKSVRHIGTLSKRR